MPDLGQMLAADRIIDLKSTTKLEALRELVELFKTCPHVGDPETFYRAIVERERIFSTGIGLGIAVPHAKSPCVKGFVMCLGRSARGIPFDSLDDLPVHIIVLIAVPEGEKEQYLKIVSKIALFLKRKEKREQVLSAPTPVQVRELFLGL